MAPVVPFITEEIYQSVFKKEDSPKSIHLESWPKVVEEEINEDIEKSGDMICRIISIVRKFKTKKNHSLRQEIKELVLKTEDENFKNTVELVKDDLKAVTNTLEIKFQGDTLINDEEFNLEIGIWI